MPHSTSPYSPTSESTDTPNESSSNSVSSTPNTLPSGLLEGEGCPSCGGAIETDQGSTYCSDCGEVLREDALSRDFPRETDHGEERRHSGPASWSSDVGSLSTDIGWVDKTTFASYSDSHKRTMGRMRVLDRQSQDDVGAERLRTYGLRETERIVAAQGFSSHHEDRASHIFELAYDSDIAMGRSIEAVASASVLAMARCEQLPATISKIVTLSTVTRNNIVQAFNAIRRELDIPIPPSHPRFYVKAITSELGLPTDVEQAAKTLLADVDDASVIAGRSPPALAAAAVYTVCHLDAFNIEKSPNSSPSLETVATTVDTSGSVISPRWRELRDIVESE